MKFSEALEQCIQGKKITRKDWNGKGMYVYYMPEHKVRIKDWRGFDFEFTVEEYSRGYVIIAGHFDMKNAQGIRIIGWVASQTDLTSDQWEVME